MTDTFLAGTVFGLCVGIWFAVFPLYNLATAVHRHRRQVAFSRGSDARRR